MADFVKIEGNVSNAVARLDSINARVANQLKTVVGALESELIGKVRAKAPQLTGALKQSIEGRVTATTTGAIAQIDVNPTGGASKGSRRWYYAIFVEYGAKLPARDILPDVNSVMRFAFGSGVVFTRKVHFPGGTVEAQQFLHGPFKEMRSRIEAQIKQVASNL